MFQKRKAFTKKGSRFQNMEDVFQKRKPFSKKIDGLPTYRLLITYPFVFVFFRVFRVFRGLSEIVFLLSQLIDFFLVFIRFYIDAIYQGEFLLGRLQFIIEFGFP